MPSCEKCWRDAHGDPEKYRRLLEKRNASGRKCTPEQQAGGEDAELCEFCGRRTVHVYSDVCMVPGCLHGQVKHDQVST